MRSLLKIAFVVGCALLGASAQQSVEWSDQQGDAAPTYPFDGKEEYAETKYSYEDIVRDIQEETDKFFDEVAQSRGIKRITQDGSFDEQASLGRRKRSLGDLGMPEYVREGLYPLAQVINREQICQGHHEVIDMQVLHFDQEDYVLCLTHDSRNTSLYHLYYGPISATRFFHNAKITTISPLLENPQKIIAFVDPNFKSKLIVIILSGKNFKHLEYQNMIWYTISKTFRGEELVPRHRNELKSINPKTSAFWPSKGQFDIKKFVLHDAEESQLKVIEFKDSSFDHQSNLDVTRDLSLVYPFNIGRKPFLLLADRQYGPSQSKDVRLMRLDEDSKLVYESSIAISEEVIDARHFVYGSKADNFLVLATPRHIMFYKQLSGIPLQFFTFQRIAMENVRQVVTYSYERRFVMMVIYKTNDVTFITYNGFRFLPSKVQRRIFILEPSPVLFYHFFPLEIENSVRMLVGRRNAIDTYLLTFTEDKSRREVWTEAFKWCRDKRNAMINYSKRQESVARRFNESYIKSDPIVIKGNLTIVKWPVDNSLQVHTREYLAPNVSGRALRIDQTYFQELRKMEQDLLQIEKDVINAGHKRLADALYLNSHDDQHMEGSDLFFTHMKIGEYTSVTASMYHHVPPPPMSLFTKHLNGHLVSNLYEDTIRLRDDRQKIFFQPLHFARIKVQPEAVFSVNATTNGRYLLGDIITRTGRHTITGSKRFHKTLIVNQNIEVTGMVNNRKFKRGTVLLKNAQQSINNPVTIKSKVHAQVAKARYVNGHPFDELLEDVVRKDESVKIWSPVEFARGVSVVDLNVDGSARLNGYNIDNLMKDVVFVDADNHTLLGEYTFHSNVTIDGHLYVRRINQKNIPGDLVLADQPNLIKSHKRFESLVMVERLNVTDSINGLAVINGMPDILLKYHSQRVTGQKTVDSVHVFNHSFVSGLINKLNLTLLEERSKQRSEKRSIKRLYVENFANFKEGVTFGRFNTISRDQFDELMRKSVAIDQQWEHLNLGEVSFSNLFVDVLECKRINGIELGNLLTRTTPQQITAPFAFNELLIQAPSVITSVNNFTMENLGKVFRKYGNQYIESKVFGSDINMASLKVKSINAISADDIVFMDRLEQKTITGVKHFKGEHLQFDNLDVDDLRVHSINAIPVRELIDGTLRHSTAQNIPRHIHFKTLAVRKEEDFRTMYINGANLRELQNDVVMASNRDSDRPMFQNVTGTKTFTGVVNFEAITFSRLFEGITNWQMQRDWMVRGLRQKVDSSFEFGKLTVRNVYVHDGYLNGVDLNVMDRTVVRLDRKSVIHSQMHFLGQVDVAEQGQILLNGKLNQIDLRKDVVYSNSNGIQTIRGEVRLLSTVRVKSNLDVNGRINGVRVNEMCTSMFQPRPNQPLVINGDVKMMAPLRVDVINGFSFEELRSGAIRHDLKHQKITGRLIVHTLTLNGVVHLSKTINNVRLENIFNNYLSTTIHDQTIKGEITLESGELPTVFADDVHTVNLFVENGIVGGVNLTNIDQHALRVHGDQQYFGDIEFADVVIDGSLDAQWINGIDTAYLMRKHRRVNSFLGETVFTRSLTVRDNLNIVQDKRVAGVNLQVMEKTAVQRNNGQQNYTISGRKTFDAVTVDVIHTEKLNNVTFSKRNLLLRNASQIITGSITFVGNVSVNSVVVKDINGHDIGHFSDKIVKKSQENVIESPVEFTSMNATKVEARALIDNVNISVLHTIANTLRRLETIEEFSKNSRNIYNSFQQNLSFIAPKFLFFELYHPVSSKDLKVKRIAKPLLVSSLSHHLAIFQISAADSKSDCFEVTVFLKNEHHHAAGWQNAMKMYSPAPVISAHLENGHVLLVSHSNSNLETNASHCLARNKVPENVMPPQGFLFQMFRLLPERQVVQMKHYVPYSKSFKAKPKVLHVSESRLVLCDEQSCTLICLGCSKTELSSVRFEDHISKVSNNKGTILVSVPNRHQVILFRMLEDRLHQLFSVPVMNAKSMLFMESYSMLTREYRQHLLICEAGNFRSHALPLVQVFAVNGTHYHKVQELNENLVEAMHVFYGKPMEQQEPYILLRTEVKIAIYRLLPSVGFQRHSDITLSDSLQWAGLTSRNYLALYFAPDCHDEEDQTVQPYIEILRPRYRQGIAFGSISQSSIIDENDQTGNKTRSETDSSLSVGN